MIYEYLQQVHDYVFCDSIDNVIECKEKEITIIINRDVMKNGYFYIDFVYEDDNKKNYMISMKNSITYPTMYKLLNLIMG